MVPRSGPRGRSVPSAQACLAAGNRAAPIPPLSVLVSPVLHRKRNVPDTAPNPLYL
ncbi:hypothetical protein CS8_069870 [Cupriavidus sp. 8B]